MLYILIPFIISVTLFFRQDRIDHFNYIAIDKQNDERLLADFKKFVNERTE